MAELAALAGPRRLREVGMGEDQIDAVVAAALERPDLGNTPNPPNAEELRSLLREAF